MLGVSRKRYTTAPGSPGDKFRYDNKGVSGVAIRIPNGGVNEVLFRRHGPPRPCLGATVRKGGLA